MAILTVLEYPDKLLLKAMVTVTAISAPILVHCHLMRFLVTVTFAGRK